MLYKSLSRIYIFDCQSQEANESESSSFKSFRVLNKRLFTLKKPRSPMTQMTDICPSPIKSKISVDMNYVTTIILAGGNGTRLEPLTNLKGDMYGTYKRSVYKTN